MLTVLYSYSSPALPTPEGNSLRFPRFPMVWQGPPIYSRIPMVDGVHSHLCGAGITVMSS